MHHPAPPPLLAPLAGQAPDRPPWFEAALACTPDRRLHAVDGARIETLSWGRAGAPGLLLLHGKMAHADWYSFIAPFFADSHRVVAPSWSGMGGSDWRDSYSVETLADEAVGVAQAEGLFDGPHKPIIVAHSFGAFAALRCAERDGARWGGVVALDMPLMSREMRERRRTPSLRGSVAPRPTRIYPGLTEALARFRFAPPQDCDNLYIADHIARGSLKQVPLEDGSGQGWTWRFDPKVADMHPGNPARSLQAAGCPIAIAWGADSVLVDGPVAAYVASLTGADVPHIEIPAARHHVMVDQPLALVSALRGLFCRWPNSAPTTST